MPVDLGQKDATVRGMKISVQRLRIAWKYRKLRPLWMRRKEIGAGALVAGAIVAGILAKTRGIKQPSEAEQ